MGDLVTAAESGDKLATLVALRNRLAAEIETTDSGRDLAALSRQLTEVLRQISEVPQTDEGSAVDEIARKRRERREAAQGESN